MKPIQPTLDFLYGLQLFGMKLGLRNIRALLAAADDPQKRFRCIHVAGTNGKGSVSAMIAAVLQEAGYRTGLYTSPHLERFNERIRVNGKPISDKDLARYTSDFREAIGLRRATFFEATTAIAFRYFADQRVDFAVVETGLGGRLDATNVVHPEVSVITSIGKDHTEHLGNSLREIAFEKGGIIKRGVPCISGVEGNAAVRELRRIARRRRSALREVARLRFSATLEKRLDRQVVSLTTKSLKVDELTIPLLGRHQVRNAAVALEAIDELRSRGVEIPQGAIRRGMRKLKFLTGLSGRFEVLRKSPLVILDVGHNPDGIRTVVETLRNYRRKRIVLVFGVMRDKAYPSMIRLLSALNPEVFAVTPASERALPAEVISRLFVLRGCRARVCPSVADGIRAAVETEGTEDLLLVCGSHYLAGEALPALRSELGLKKP